MTYEIKHFAKKCIGCGACVCVDPDRWEFDEETGKARLKEGVESKEEKDVFILKVEKLNNSKDAEDNCPVPCIFIKKISE